MGEGRREQEASRCHGKGARVAEGKQEKSNNSWSLAGYNLKLLLMKNRFAFGLSN